VPIGSDEESFFQFQFLANVNTDSFETPPHYSTIAVTTNPKNTNTKILGIKSKSTITIVSIDENNKVREQAIVEVESSLPNKKAVVTCFTFLRECGQTPEYAPLNGMLIGLQSGLVALVDFTTNQILQYFNFDPKQKEPFKKKAVVYILPQPTCDSDFIVIFSDSSCLVFSMDLEQDTNVVYEFIERIESKLPSDLSFHKLENNRRKKILAGILSHEVLTQSSSQTPELNFLAFPNTVQSSSNPMMYFKFNCITISDAKLFASPSLDHICKRPPQPGTSDYIILLLTSFDGFLRIYDFYRLDPLLSFKSIYGGISSVELTYNGSHAVMGCQDDRIVVLNLRNHSYQIIEGHKSFVTGASFFLGIFGRIFACSIDGLVSLTDIEETSKKIGEKLAVSTLVNVENNKTLVTIAGVEKDMMPTEHFLNKSDVYVSKRIMAKLEDAESILTISKTVPVNDEGIAFLMIREDVFLTSSYDGCVSIWKIIKKTDSEARKK
jgi:hypothetical protein